MAGRRKGRLAAILLALAATLSLTACGGPNFDSLKGDLKFGDEEISDTQTVYSMKIPSGGVGKLIRGNQLAYAQANWANAINPYFNGSAKAYLAAVPANQCVALANTYQEETSEQGPWTYNASTGSCDKTRKLSWLEKTMWTMYEQQSDDTIDWLSTSRNTLVASGGTVSTLQANATPMYDAWDANANKYLNIAQAVLVIAAAISLTILGARIVWRIGEASGGGMDGHLLGRVGWIFLGVFMGSSAASIALMFFKRASTTYMGDPAGASHVTNPSLMSWTPGEGTSFFVSDWVRLQVDPFLLIAAVCGVLAAGFRLVVHLYAFFCIALGVLLALVKDPAGTSGRAAAAKRRTGSDRQGNVLTDLKTLAAIPELWLVAAIVFCGYQVFWATYSFSAYLHEGNFGLSATAAGFITTLKLWMRPIGGIGGGFLGDRVSKVSVLFWALLLAALSLVGLIAAPAHSPQAMLVVLVLFIGILTYAIRGLYWSLLDDCKVPAHCAGLAIGLISVLGYSPDVFVPLINGYVTQTFPGAHGYQLYFGYIAAIALCGAGAAAFLKYRLTRIHRIQESA